MLTRAGRRIRRCVAGVIVLASGLALPLAAANPARADPVRDAQQWVLNALDVPSAWQLSQGRGVLVAVIDSGVNPDVSDLAGSVSSGPDLTGVGTPDTNPGWGMHGTWMASLIAGHGHGPDGQDGITGVAPLARILSIRVITDRSDPGYARYLHEPPGRGQQELATAIRFAVTHGAGVISMSLGYETPSLAVLAALQLALNHNVVVIASSGNSGTAQTAQGVGHAPYSYPANYLGVLGVAAINEAGQPAYFSSENLSVQVAAPGVNVPSQGRDGKYWLVSGTSPACALTAGVAALIKSRFPKLTATQIRSAITSTAQHGPPGGYNDQIGFGTVDALAALSAAGRLARQIPGGNSAAARADSAGYFGAGPAAVPPVPVAPRGIDRLFLLCALAAGCLLVVAVSAWWFAAARRAASIPGAAGVVGFGATGLAGSAGPATGFQGTAVDLRFPQSGYPAQPRPGEGYPGQAGPGQPYPGAGYQPQPGQSYPGQGYPGQAGPGQSYPGQGYPGQAGPGQPYPGQGHPGQGSPGPGYQPQPGQSYPGQGYPGQLGPSRAQPGQSYPGQGSPGQAGPGQPYPGQGSPGPGFQPLPGQSYPGQPGPGQPVPGQVYPGPGYQPQSRPPGPTQPGQSQSGQPHPAQGHPGVGYQGQTLPGRPHLAGPQPPQPGQAYPGQLQPGQPGQPSPGQPSPGQPYSPHQAQGYPGQGFPSGLGPAIRDNAPAPAEPPAELPAEPPTELPAEPDTEPQPRWDVWTPDWPLAAPEGGNPEAETK